MKMLTIRVEDSTWIAIRRLEESGKAKSIQEFVREVVERALKEFEKKGEGNG